MKENKLIKFLIPVVALIVVFESIILVSNLDKSTTKNIDMVEKVSDDKQTLQQKEKEEPVADFIWETENLEMKIGKSYKVVLNLLTKTDLELDSVETHIYFDSKKVTVSKLETNKKIGEALKPSGVNNERGFITVISWKDDEGPGYEAKANETVEVLSFMVTPKIEGVLDFDLSTSKTDNKLATILLESNTVKSLPYLSNKLEINVIK